MTPPTPTPPSVPTPRSLPVRAPMRIVRASYLDIHDVTSLIAAAFADLDVAGWLVPAPNDRPLVLYAQFRMLVEHAAEHGFIDLTGDRLAAAVWFPREAPLPEIHGYEQRLQAACGRYTDRFHALDTAFEAHHPTQAHHHLALLAVDPRHHGQGHGTALLRHHHTHLDHHDMPAYLEAASPRSRALYLRHGYRDHGTPIDLPDQGPRLWPMWREPRPTSPPPALGWAC